MQRFLAQITACFRIAVLATACSTHSCRSIPVPDPFPVIVLVACEAISAESLVESKAAGAECILLRVEERDVVSVVAAATQVRAARLKLGYWVEVARSPALATAHPECQASLQGHDQWRALFPDAPLPGPDQVIKVHPWVPITTRPGFELQLARVTELLQSLPRADVVYLNDLQSAPSACGCGHPWCRWATDYHFGARTPVIAGEPMPADAAARFLVALRERFPKSEWVPVWVPECGESDELCHGVPCFEGRCWTAFEEQWVLLAEVCPKVALVFPEPPSDRASIQHALQQVEEISLRRRAEHGTQVPELVPVVTEAQRWSTDLPWIRRDTTLDQSWNPVPFPR